MATLTTVGAFFKALGEFLGLIRQNADPEVNRLKSIGQIDLKLARERLTRDKLLAGSYENEEQKEKMAIALGVATSNIIRLRRERQALER